jgi:hypothetical protein
MKKLFFVEIIDAHRFALPEVFQGGNALVGMGNDTPCGPKEGRWDKK